MNLSDKVDEIEDFLDGILQNPSYNNDISLFTGIGGAPIFYALLYEYKRDKKYINKIDVFIEFSFEYLNNNHNIMGLTYCDGLCGFGQILNFLAEKQLTEIDVSEAIYSVDEIIYQNINHFLAEVDLLPHEDKVEQIDFLHGVFGLAHYLISRPKNSHRQKLFNLFDKLAEIVEVECTLAFTVKDEVSINGNTHKTNIGLAHGHISYILIFSKFYELYPDKANIKKVIKSSAYLVLSFKNKDSQSEYIFPGIAVNAKTANYDVHLGWCYGDQSVAFGLYKAGTILKDDLLISVSKKTAASTLSRVNLAAAQVFDAGFCHGASSVGYLHLKWYLLTHDGNHLNAYNQFIKETLAFCEFREGIAGYKKYNGPDNYSNNIGMLDGLIGAGIFLLDAKLENRYSDWDSFFLLN